MEMAREADERSCGGSVLLQHDWPLKSRKLLAPASGHPPPSGLSRQPIETFGFKFEGDPVKTIASFRQAPTANFSVTMVYQTPVRAAEFKSAYGPKYTFQPHLDGWNKTTLFRNTLRTASYGGAAAVGLLYYVSGIPRVQEDILQKIPFVGRYFVKEEVDPQDNPF